MVEPDPTRVEEALRGGELACPCCGGMLGPWGWSRGRRLRGRGGGWVRVRPRRGRCRACRVTHVLLPVVGLVRRMDLVEVIGAALLARAAGTSQRRLAAELGVARSTVRGWLGRFAAHAEPIRAHFTRLAIWLDAQASPPPPRGSPVADAVEAIGLAAIVAARRFGPANPWQLAAGVSGGLLLAAGGSAGGWSSASAGQGRSNTSPPLAGWW